MKNQISITGDCYSIQFVALLCTRYTSIVTDGPSPQWCRIHPRNMPAVSSVSRFPFSLRRPFTQLSYPGARADGHLGCLKVTRESSLSCTTSQRLHFMTLHVSSRLSSNIAYSVSFSKNAGSFLTLPSNFFHQSSNAFKGTTSIP